MKESKKKTQALQGQLTADSFNSFTLKVSNRWIVARAPVVQFQRDNLLICQVHDVHLKVLKYFFQITPIIISYSGASSLLISAPFFA